MHPAVVSVFWLVPVVALALVDRRRLVYTILLIAGIPMSILAPGQLALGPLGEVSVQAAVALIISLGLVLAIAADGAAALRATAPFSVYGIFLLYSATTLAWTDGATEGVRFLVKLATPPLFAVVVATNLRANEDDPTALRICIWSATIVLGLAFVDAGTGGALGRSQSHWISEGVITAPYMSPANFSFLMGVACLAALSRYLGTQKTSSLLLCLALGLAVLGAFTRISMAGVIAGASLLLFFRGRTALSRFGLPLAALAGSIAAVFLSESLRTRMFFSADSVSIDLALKDSDALIASVNTSGRTALWTDALNHFQNASPTFGAGIGSVDQWLSGNSTANALHSEYLRLFLDTGAVGLALYLAALIQILRGLLRRYRLAALIDASGCDAPALAIAALFFYAVTLMTDNSLNYVSEFGIYVFGCIGLAIAADGRDKKNHMSPEQASPTRQSVARRIENLLP